MSFENLPSPTEYLLRAKRERLAKPIQLRPRADQAKEIAEIVEEEKKDDPSFGRSDLMSAIMGFYIEAYAWESEYGKGSRKGSAPSGIDVYSHLPPPSHYIRRVKDERYVEVIQMHPTAAQREEIDTIVAKERKRDPKFAEAYLGRAMIDYYLAARRWEEENQSG